MSTDTVLSDANNYMAQERHIVELVKAAVAGSSPAVHVLTVAELGDIKEQLQRTPAVHVVHAGFKVLDARSDAKKVHLRNTWLVVAVVAAPHNIGSGATLRAQGGTLLAKAAAHLMGKQLPHTITPLTPVDSPKAWFAAGFSYFPMAFAVESFFSAA